MYNMSTSLFKTFCKERNLSPGSVNVYENALTHYCNFNGMTLEELLHDAIEDEKNHPWRERKLLHRLIDFRNYLIDEGYSSTKMADRAMTFYRHYFVEINSLPRTNHKKISEIKIPTVEDLQKAIEISDPLMEALIEMLVSTGLCKIDLLKLRIKDLLKAVDKYYTSNDIYEALHELAQRDDVIAVFALIRTKTKKFHYTFASPEAIKATVAYLLSRPDRLTLESPVFKISYHWLTVKFEQLNEQLNLGVTRGNNYNVLRCHTLRKYHATTLRNDGLSIDIVNSLQGKAKNTVDAAYFIDTPEALEKEYREHVNCLCINWEVKNVKSPEYVQMESENEMLRKQNDEINSRMDGLEKLVLGNISEEKLSKLQELL